MFEIPTASTFFANAGTWSIPLGQELFPIAAVLVGIVVASLLAVTLRHTISDAIASLFHRNDKFN